VRARPPRPERQQARMPGPQPELEPPPSAPEPVRRPEQAKPPVLEPVTIRVPQTEQLRALEPPPSAPVLAHRPEQAQHPLLEQARVPVKEPLQAWVRGWLPGQVLGLSAWERVRVPALPPGLRLASARVQRPGLLRPGLRRAWAPRPSFALPRMHRVRARVTKQRPRRHAASCCFYAFPQDSLCVSQIRHDKSKP
jgi:hypothetical protein